MSLKFFKMFDLLERLQHGTEKKETTRSSEVKDAIDDGEDKRDDEEVYGDVEKVVKKKRIKKKD